MPIESQIKEELEDILNQPEKTKTEIAIEVNVMDYEKTNVYRW